MHFLIYGLLDKSIKRIKLYTLSRQKCFSINILIDPSQVYSFLRKGKVQEAFERNRIKGKITQNVFSKHDLTYPANYF